MLMFILQTNTVRLDESISKSLKSTDVNIPQKLIAIYATVMVHYTNHGKLLHNEHKYNVPTFYIYFILLEH